MAFHAERVRKLRSFVVHLCVTLVFVYFSYHLLSGQNSIFAMMRLEQQFTELQAKADDLRAERLKMEDQVGMLYSKSLDLDMLDEQARRVLGYTRPDEIVYFLPKKAVTVK